MRVGIQFLLGDHKQGCDAGGRFGGRLRKRLMMILYGSTGMVWERHWR